MLPKSIDQQICQCSPKLGEENHAAKTAKKTNLKKLTIHVLNTHDVYKMFFLSLQKDQNVVIETWSKYNYKKMKRMYFWWISFQTYFLITFRISNSFLGIAYLPAFIPCTPRSTWHILSSKPDKGKMTNYLENAEKVLLSPFFLKA